MHGYLKGNDLLYVNTAFSVLGINAFIGYAMLAG